MKAKNIIQGLMQEHPEWEWESLDGQGFYEIMQAYRHAPIEDQRAIILCYAVVQQYIRFLLAKQNQQQVENLKPRQIAVKNADFEDGYKATFIEAKLLLKVKLTKTEKVYLDLANELKVDLATILLISQMVNGHDMKKEDVAQWAKKQMGITNKNRQHSKNYYKWLYELIHFMPRKTFVKFYLKPQEVKKQKAIGLLTTLEKGEPHA